jgi:uncharacterized tellurite resistance protein B-like protein
MNRFSGQEKRTILHLLTMIMEADSVIHPKEIDYINSLMKDFGLSSAEFDHMDMLDFSTLKNEFYMMSDEKQDIAKEYFMNMAKADGYIHNDEWNIINSLK